MDPLLRGFFSPEDIPFDKEGRLANALLTKGYRDVLQFSFGCYTNPDPAGPMPFPYPPGDHGRHGGGSSIIIVAKRTPPRSIDPKLANSTGGNPRFVGRTP